MTKTIDVPETFCRGKAVKIKDSNGREHWRLENYEKEKPIPLKEMNSVFLGYQEKMVSRMKGFMEQAQKMDKKYKDLIAKLTELGVVVDSLSVSDLERDEILNRKRRPKMLHFEMIAHKGTMKLHGTLLFKPATMKLNLVSNEYYSSVYNFSYYKTLRVRDNYLSTLINGKKIEDEDVFYVKPLKFKMLPMVTATPVKITMVGGGGPF